MKAERDGMGPMLPKDIGVGRAETLATLDRLLAKSRNRKTLLAAMEARLEENPALFFRKVVMPLLPRDTTLSVESDGVLEWRSLPTEKPVSNAQKDGPR